MKRWRSWLFTLCLAVVAGAACESPKGGGGPLTSSESHFLTNCNESCGSGLECLCGVCTRACSNDASCATVFAGAECVDVASRPAASSCPSSAASAFCDEHCAADSDCAALGAGFSCQAGFCRQVTLVSGDRVELDQVCGLYVAETCRAKIDCYGWDYASYDACLAAQECDGFARLNQMLAAGEVSYDAKASADCVERLSADPCMFGPILFSVPTLPEALALCNALVGQLAAGAACDDSTECAPGLACNLDSTCPSTCAVPAPTENLPQGAACVPEVCLTPEPHCSECALGLECVNQVCVPTPAVGDACTGILGCGDALWCNSATGHCAPLAKLGEACSDFRQIAPNCEDGLWCDDPPAMPDVTGTCKAIANQGEPCRSDDNCATPLACLPQAGATPVDHGMCGAKQANGAPCDSFADCVSDLCDSSSVCVPQPALGAACTDTCADGFSCSSGVCLTKRYAGDPCGATDTCINSRCSGGTCTLRGHFGATCAVDDDCLSGHCQGSCVDPVGCTQ
jgi:hypothetical protein